MIEENYELFKDLLKSTGRDGVDKLIEFLDTSDIKTAPASVKYHQNHEGGLIEHSLNVYNNLVKIVDQFGEKDKYSKDSIILVSLLHDLAKVNFYETYDKNVKVDGQWVQERHYRIRDLKDRFSFGTHEQTSLFIAQQFVQLSIEEQAAIVSHHGGQGINNTPIDAISDIYSKYKLPIYLHVADLLDAFSE